MSRALPKQWQQALALTGRLAPDLYIQGDSIADVPHAAVIRTALNKLGLAAVHCIQGMPTIGFLVLNENDTSRVDRVHSSLWNQGLMTLLFVIVGDQLRAYSLARKPHDPDRAAEHPHSRRHHDPRLIRQFKLVEQAIELRDLVTGVESGRVYKESDFANVLKPAERIDRVLLDNLLASDRLLQKVGLDADESQALLMQSMFIAYLEDRSILDAEYFISATDNPKITGFRDLLEHGNPKLLHSLFSPLHADFNGDLFHSPCSFGEQAKHHSLTREHLRILADFIWGQQDMESQQLRLWSYEFRYIPVELISAVYDRLLAKDTKEKKEQGAFYTPLFLADLVVDQAWGLLNEEQRKQPIVMDPACGSGIFLVRMFERLVEHRRSARTSHNLPWHTLKALVSRLHGIDKNPRAVRIAVFSLYLALLEQRNPPEIKALMDEGKMLPPLWGNSLREANFFDIPERRDYDLLIGNPPWVSRRKGRMNDAVSWCEKNNRPIPHEQYAWGFLWKSMCHTREKGLIALLLPAMGILHNDASSTALRQWLHEIQVERLINFADLRHLLFDGARPASMLALFKPCRSVENDYRFDYWRPKADLNIQTRRQLTLSHADRGRVSLNDALINKDLFKQQLLMKTGEVRLFNYLGSMPRLNELVHRLKDIPKKERGKLEDQWIIGQGFTQGSSERMNEPGYAKECLPLEKLPFFDASEFTPLVLPFKTGKPSGLSRVYRKGYVDGFFAPHILLPKIIHSSGRIKAAFDDKDRCFFNTLNAITFPRDQEVRAKFLAAMMNSRLISWFLLHETGSIGVEIPELHIGGLLLAPFPSPDEMDNPGKAKKAMSGIVSLMDERLSKRVELLKNDDLEYVLRKIDKLVYRYFGLDKDEIALIDETFDEIIPAIQPGKGRFPSLWRNSTEKDWRLYLKELEVSLQAWMKGNTYIHAKVLANSQDSAIVRIRLGNSSNEEDSTEEWQSVLNQLWPKLQRPDTRSQNIQIISDLRLYDGDDLYLFKPLKRRFWLRSTAIDDAASIAAEIFSASRG